MSDASETSMPVTRSEYLATFALLGMFVVTMVLAILMAGPFDQAQLQAFEDPSDPINAAWYIVLLIAFTFVILWIYKRGHKWVIQVIILGAVASTILYGAIGFGTLMGYSYDQSAIAGLVVGGLAALWLWRNPEWYVIDAVGLLVAASAAALLGISLGIVPTVILLVGLAVYDAIAVYKTKHMLDLADAVIERRLPVLLVIPKNRGYSFRQEAAAFKQASKENKGEREAMFMGLGDLVMPSILVVSAFVFLPGAAGPDLLEAEFRDPVTYGDGNLRLTAEVVEQASMPLEVRYHLDAVNLTDSDSFAWTLDWDLDAEHEDEGVGLPATVTATYTDVQAICVVFAKEGASGCEDDGTNKTVLGATMNEAGPWYVVLEKFLQHKAALGAAIGTLVGFLALMTFVLKGNPQAGLPLLNGGAIAGFLVGLYASTGSLVFW